MSFETIESYLVGLHFDIDAPSLSKFTGALKLADTTTAGVALNIGADILKAQFYVTSAFAAMGLGAIGFIDKLAMTDQQMRLLAQRSFTSLDQFRNVQTVIDAMGVSIEDVSNDMTGELQKRFESLMAVQRNISGMLGPHYEQQMHDVRDVIQQFDQLKIEAQGFLMMFGSKLLDKMDLGSIDQAFAKFNEFFLQNMPKWSDELATDFAPILKDVWKIMQGTELIAEDLGLAFTNFMSIVTNDDSLAGAEFSFHKFAKAVEEVAHGIAVTLELALKLERLWVRFGPALMGPLGAGYFIAEEMKRYGGPYEAFDAARVNAGKALGLEVSPSARARDMDGRAPDTEVRPLAAPSGSVPDQARQVAKVVSAKTDIPANLIYGQMAFETANFSHMAGQNNLSGIRYPGSTKFRDFDSTEDYANTYAKILKSKRYIDNGVREAKTPEEFAHALNTKSGIYYGKASEERSYAAGVDRYSRNYAPAPTASLTIQNLTVHVPKTATTPHEIHRHVAGAVKDGLDAHNRRLLADTGNGFR